MLCQWMLYYPQKETAKKKRGRGQEREGSSERTVRKGLFRNRVCGSELRRWLPLQFTGFPFSLRGVVCGFNK